MATVTCFSGATSLHLLYIPNFEQDRQPVPGSPWFSPRIPPADTVVKAILDGRVIPTSGDLLRKRKRPSAWDWGDHEYGPRVDVSMEPLPWGLTHFYAWDENPSNFIVGRVVGDAGTRLVVQ